MKERRNVVCYCLKKPSDHSSRRITVKNGRRGVMDYTLFGTDIFSLYFQPHLVFLAASAPAPPARPPSPRAPRDPRSRRCSPSPTSSSRSSALSCSRPRAQPTSPPRSSPQRCSPPAPSPARWCRSPRSRPRASPARSGSAPTSPARDPPSFGPARLLLHLAVLVSSCEVWCCFRIVKCGAASEL